MKLMRYIVIAVFFVAPLFVNAQVTTIVTDTSKHNPIVNDTSKHAPVVVFIPPPPVPDSNIHVYQTATIKNMDQKIYDYQRYSHCTSPGFRVQVDFSQERNSINNTKSNFSLKYPSTPSYITYKQPYFRLSAGDFRTRLEAVSFLNKVKKDYPGAFLVADKIAPPPLQ